MSEMPVFEFRPLPESFGPWASGEVHRFAEGEWIPDDGMYDLAFAAGGVCLYVELPYQRNIRWSWLNQHWAGFENKHPRGNPWHYMLAEGASEWGGGWGRDRHPNSLAGRSGMDFIVRERSAANGRHVAFNLNDKHIAAGLVRERATGDLVRFPESPVCMYCGPDLSRSLVAVAEYGPLTVSAS